MAVVVDLFHQVLVQGTTFLALLQRFAADLLEVLLRLLVQAQLILHAIGDVLLKIFEVILRGEILLQLLPQRGFGFV